MNLYQLCTTTAYEIGNSVILPDSYAKRAQELGYNSIAVTDDNIRCYPSFADACSECGIRPIFGLKITLSSSKTYPYKGYLYIKDEEGYKNICYLLSTKEKVIGIDFLKYHHEGLKLVIQADNDNFFQDYFLTTISKDVFAYRKIFKDDFAFGITINSKEDKEDAITFYTYCKNNEYKVLAFPEIRYLLKPESKKLDLFKAGINKEHYVEKEDGPYFLLSEKALTAIYRECDIEECEDFFKDCIFQFFIKRGNLITFDDEDETLKKEAYNGLKERFGSAIKQEYLGRLEYELSVIKEMKFSSYFLLVKDYVSYAKRNDIKVGPGRGSAGGSLVAYALSITEIDPIKYDLSFERFLNPKRKTMPDIDIDFDDEKRNKVVEYLVKRYGESHVCTIRTYSCLKPKSALKLIGPALSVQENRIKEICRFIPDNAKTFEEALNDNSWSSRKLKELLSDTYYQDLVNKAKGLLKLPVNLSFHAPGVIVSKDEIYLTCPRENGQFGTVEFEYPYMERLGFLKVDILSLSNLTFIKKIEDEIVKSDKSIPNIENNLNDEETFNTLNRLDLAEIFQLDATIGMKQTIQQVKPRQFTDIPAILSLYRPGPKDYISLYADRKNGVKKITYSDSRLEPILKETYGIMVYQEQVIKAVQVLASFSASDADLFRRAISKKNIAKMEMYKEQFLEGTKKNGINKDKALEIYQDIEKFANYGFNKSHAYCYSMITYRLLYYKTHFFEEFYRVAFRENSLSSIGGYNLIKEITKKKIHFHVPNINHSLKDDILFDCDKVYLPFKAVSGIDDDLIDIIIEERNNGLFVSFYDLIKRIESKTNKNNRRTLLNLIMAGGLDELSKNRKAMEEHMNQYFDFAKMSFPDEMIPDLEDVKEDIGERLAEEKSKLGMIFSKSLSSIAKKEGFKTLIITDTSKVDYDHTVTASSEAADYQIRLTKEEVLKKNDIVLVDADFDTKFKTIKPNKIILCRKEN